MNRFINQAPPPPLKGGNFGLMIAGRTAPGRVSDFSSATPIQLAPLMPASPGNSLVSKPTSASAARSLSRSCGPGNRLRSNETSNGIWCRPHRLPISRQNSSSGSAPAAANCGCVGAASPSAARRRECLVACPPSLSLKLRVYCALYGPGDSLREVRARSYRSSTRE